MSRLSTRRDTSAKKRWRNKATETQPMRSNAFLCAEGLCKSYTKAGVSVPVLKDVRFALQPSEFCAIIGQSGSGKSTLLHLLATLDHPDAGSIYYQGERIDTISSRGKETLRNGQFGMIFQFYHLLPELTALENVMLPAMIGTSSLRFLSKRRAVIDRARGLLDQVGLSHRVQHKPSEMSGGEMQRTAIARALIAEPQVLFADEPTGNLDRKTGQQIMEILHRLNGDQGLTIVMVTHDQKVAESAHRAVYLFDHQIATSTS